MATDLWPLIHAERAAIAADIDGLDDAAWQTQSLCGKWTVGQVLAHMTSSAMMTPPQFLAKLAASGFRFPVYADREVAKYHRPSPGEGLEVFRRAAHRTSAPPGPKATWVGEVVVHSQDIRRPLGISHDYDPEALRIAAEFYTKSNVIIGSRDRIADVRLEATDADWSFGQGPIARGPMLAIVMAMTGRKTFLDELTGEGTDVMRQRS